LTECRTLRRNHAKLESAWQMYHRVKTGDYLSTLQGTINLPPPGTY
jgi:hypothetical protein